MGTGSTVGRLVYKMQLFLKPMRVGILDSALPENIAAPFQLHSPSSQGTRALPVLSIAVLFQGLGTPLTLTHHQPHFQ